MKLAECKSAKVIEDPSEIESMLKRSLERAPTHNMSVSKTDDGVMVRKTSALIMREAPKIPDVDALRALAESRGFTWFEGMNERVVSYWASDERVDGHGDIVRQNWDFSEYEDSPVLMFHHNWGDPPIGGSLDWGVVDRKDDKYEGPALNLLTFYASEQQYPFADTIFRLAKARIMRAGSVGFYSRKLINITDEDERAELGLGQYGYVLDNNVLIEFSPCSIGANPGALIAMSNAKTRGLLRPHDMPILREITRHSLKCNGQKDLWKSTDLQLRGIERMLFPSQTITVSTDIDKPIVEINEPNTFQCRKSKRLKSVIASADIKDIQTTEQKLDALITLVSDWAQSMSIALEDIRSMVEAMVEEESTPTDASSDEPAKTQQTLLTRIARVSS